MRSLPTSPPTPAPLFTRSCAQGLSHQQLGTPQARPHPCMLGAPKSRIRRQRIHSLPSTTRLQTTTLVARPMSFVPSKWLCPRSSAVGRGAAWTTCPAHQPSCGMASGPGPSRPPCRAPFSAPQDSTLPAWPRIGMFVCVACMAMLAHLIMITTCPPYDLSFAHTSHTHHAVMLHASFPPRTLPLVTVPGLPKPLQYWPSPMAQSWAPTGR